MLVILSIVVILGMSSVAIDVGRLFTQQRFMQNAVDAAALAGGKAIVINAGSAGATVLTIEQAARDILAIDLAASPVGTPAAVPADPPVFDGASTGPNLVDGVVVTDAAGTPLADTAGLSTATDVRVAIRASVDFMLGRAIGVNAGNVAVHAHVKLDYGGKMMPIAARRYVGGVGPNNPVPNPCPEIHTSNMFFDLAATSETDCTGSVDTTASPLSYNGRSPASPTDPGPIIELVGQGADAYGGGVSFRGFITLDIRNFQSTTSRVYYNGVTSGTNAQTLKSMEAGWVPKGYPGPAFPPVISPPDPQDQVGIMDGNSAGIIVDAMQTRFNVGDMFICALYDGTVRTIPAFWLTSTSPIPALTAGAPPLATAGAVQVTPNKAFVDQVALSIVQKPDWLTIGFPPGNIAPNYPQGTTINFTNASVAAGTPDQVDTVWVKGADTNVPNNQNAPDFYLPVPVMVGSVDKDFSWSPTSPQLAPSVWGDFVTFNITITTDAANNFTGSNDVVVSTDQSGTVAPAWPAGSFWFNGTQGQTTATVSLSTPTGQGSHHTRSGSFTFTVNTTALGGQATYSIPLVFTATNSSGESIRHVDVLKVLGNVQQTSSNYVDIIGFAAYRITSMDANTIWGQIVTPIAATPDDGQLRIALQPRLVPWSP